MKINPKSILYRTIVLSLANFIVRILGFAYRVFLSRMIGPQGMGLVQLVYPVFHIAVTLTVAGIPIAVSRLISEKNIIHDARGMRRTMTVSLTLVTIISTVLTLAALLNLDFISQVIIKDARTKGALFILFPCVIFIGLGATLKGFFYGQKEIHPPALAEIIEQLTRMAAAIGLLYWMVPKEDFGLAAMLVMLATVLGEVASLLFLHTRYGKLKQELGSSYLHKNETAPMQNSRYKDNVFHDKIHNNRVYQDRAFRDRARKNPGQTDSIGKVAKSIFAIAMPITATRLVNSLMSAANSILIPQRLMASGMLREEAVGLLGIVSGMVLPLVFLPFTITNALSVVLIPNLSESMAVNRWKDIQSKIDKALRLTCIIAFPSSALLIALGKPVGDLLYQQSLVGTFLVPVSYFLVFHALQHTSSGILNGLGKQTKAAIHFMIGSVIQLVCTYFLLANPAIRIWGILIGFSLSSLIVMSANIVTVLKTSKLHFRFMEWILKPGSSALLMGISMKVVYEGLSGLGVPVVVNILVSALFGIFLFLLCLWVIGSMPAPAALLKKFQA